MHRQFYYTSQFAQKVGVTIRTLRYYDKIGLFSPTGHTEAGYRLYTDEDLLYLQQILLLRFLGYGLDEIKQMLQIKSINIRKILVFQKMMTCEKKMHIDAIIEAIAEGEAMLQSEKSDTEIALHIIQAIQRQTVETELKETSEG